MASAGNAYLGIPPFEKSGRPIARTGAIDYVARADVGTIEELANCPVGPGEDPYYEPLQDVEEHHINEHDRVYRIRAGHPGENDYTDFNSAVLAVLNGMGIEEQRALGKYSSDRMVKEAIKSNIEYVGVAVDPWKQGKTYSTLTLTAGGANTMRADNDMPTGCIAVVDLPDADLALDDPNHAGKGRDRRRMTLVSKPLDTRESGEIYMEHAKNIIRNGQAWRAAMNRDSPTTGAMNFAVNAGINSFAFAAFAMIKLMIERGKLAFTPAGRSELGLRSNASAAEQISSMAAAMDLVGAYQGQNEYMNLLRDTMLTIFYDDSMEDYFIGNVPGGRRVGIQPETERPSSDAAGGLAKMQLEHLTEFMGGVHNLYVDRARWIEGKVISGDVKGRTYDVALGVGN